MANILHSDGRYIKAAGAGSDADPHIPQVSLTVETVEATNVGITALPKVTTATLSNVASSASNVTLLAENTDRIGVLVQNDSTATLYLKYGATASTSSYTVKMEPGSYWEMPQPIYTGIIDGIWSAANGAARITELE